MPVLNSPSFLPAAPGGGASEAGAPRGFASGSGSSSSSSSDFGSGAPFVQSSSSWSMPASSAPSPASAMAAAMCAGIDGGCGGGKRGRTRACLASALCLGNSGASSAVAMPGFAATIASASTSSGTTRELASAARVARGVRRCFATLEAAARLYARGSRASTTALRTSASS